MAEQIAMGPPTDTELTGYIDGELDDGSRRGVEARIGANPEVQARLATLKSGVHDFGPIYDLLLDAAPTARLDAILAAADVRATATSHRSPLRLALIAAGILLFILGAAVGYLVPGAVRGPGEQQFAGDDDSATPNWRAVVAEYLTLYTNDTLATIPDDAALRARELQTVGDRLGLPLDQAAVTLPDLLLKRAQLFQWRDMPLGQVAYMSGNDGPVAFCIIKNGKPDAAAAFEEREGKNIVFWNKDGRGFMVIGMTPRPQLETFAATLQSRLS